MPGDGESIGPHVNDHDRQQPHPRHGTDGGLEGGDAGPLVGVCGDCAGLHAGEHERQNGEAGVEETGEAASDQGR